jgi:hypothetical protein
VNSAHKAPPGQRKTSKTFGGKVDLSRTYRHVCLWPKVLSRGETLAAPAGRADDFSWPRSGSEATARPEVSPEPAVPDTPEKLGTAANGDGKNQADAKKKPAIDSGASARLGPHRIYNYYRGRHHVWYGGHHYGWYHRW